MKKPIMFMKTLLVAAGLLVGESNAWAGDVSVLYEKGTTGHDWVSDDASDWTQSGGTLTLETAGWQITGSNGTHSFVKTIAPADNTIIDIEAEFYLRANTGRYWSGSKSTGDNASYFRFGNIYILENGQD